MLQRLYRQHRELTLWLLVSGMLTIAGLVFSLIKGPDLAFPDERQYAEIARNIIRINMFSLDGETPTAYRPPGYPIFLLLPFSVYDSVHTARIANFLLLAGALILLHGIVSKFYSRGAGWSAVFLIFCYPVLMYTAGTLYPQTLALFLIVAISWLLMLGRESLALAITVGLANGYLALVAPLYLFTLPLCVLLAPLLCGWSWRNGIVVVLVALLLLGSWSVRNYVALGVPVFISTNIAGNLAESEVSTPETAVEVPDSHTLSNADVRKPRFGVLRIVASIVRQPGDYFSKVGNYFHFRNKLVTSTEQTAFRDIVMFVSYYSIVALVILRLGIRKKIELCKFDTWVLAMYFSAALFHALAFTRIRYRLPLDFLLLGVAGIGLYWLLEMIRQKVVVSRTN